MLGIERSHIFQPRKMPVIEIKAATPTYIHISQRMGIDGHESVFRNNFGVGFDG